ncbi:MAG: hypothetical protein KGS73_18780, partial [Chloroflexi bacterium]|nr:hypothetical protein [Chloroflexota bacterium]
RLRKDNGAENMATLRRMALSLLKQDKTVKLGIKNKRLKATWDHDYLIPYTATHAHDEFRRDCPGGAPGVG